MPGKAIEVHFCEGIPIMEISLERYNVMAIGKNELQGSKWLFIKMQLC